MTIAACYHSDEGLIIGADSTATVAPPNPQGFDVAIRHFNHAQKIFEIGEKFAIGPMGLAVYGLGEMGPISPRSLIADFADELEANPPIAMDEVAERWSQKVWDAFSATYAPQIARAKGLAANPNRTEQEEKDFRALSQLAGGYFLGGRLQKSHRTYAYSIEYDWSMAIKRPPSPIPTGTMGHAGCTNVMLRLIFGYDPKIIDNLMASGKWSGTRDELIASMSVDRLMPGTVLSIRDAVDLVYSMIYTTIKGLRFSQFAPLCGGPIEIASITTDRAFRWVIHKDLGVAVHRAFYNET